MMALAFHYMASMMVDQTTPNSDHQT